MTGPTTSPNSKAEAATTAPATAPATAPQLTTDPGLEALGELSFPAGAISPAEIDMILAPTPETAPLTAQTFSDLVRRETNDRGEIEIGAVKISIEMLAV